MAGLSLPKLRWLVIGAIAAGIWVVREDMKAPRPPEPVSHQKQRATNQRATDTKPRPPKPVAARVATKSAEQRQALAKPSPAKPLAGKQPIPPKPVEKNALILPRTIERPPARPQDMATGSIKRPEKANFVQTKTRVRLRAQARLDAAVIATLEPNAVMRELARSGDWLLVMGDGRKGWMRKDYVEASSFLKRRPKLPLAEVSQRGAAR